MEARLAPLIEEFGHLRIQMEDIRSATDGFNRNKLIGGGGFGQVYKGELSLDHTMVAFKRLDRGMGQGNMEFFKVILMLSSCKHENLVSLLHFSIEGDERVLVYEYASRGSLDRYLGDGNLTWEQRLRICIGVANALRYLHDPMKNQQQGVLHRDIKSANILLDEHWTAKLSDFGLSTNQPRSYTFSNPVGTYGYCDPLYAETGFLSKESDVYSFGMVLFEVLCGRLCFYSEFNGNRVHDWKRYYDEKKLDDFILQDLKEQIDLDSLITFSTIASQCLNRDHRERPTMDKIVKQLEVALSQQNIADNSYLVEISKLLPPVSYRSYDQLILLLSEGILVDQGKRWLSINKNKQFREMISATQCMYGQSFFPDSIAFSRFSNAIIVPSFTFKLEARAQFLLPHTTYTINLIFGNCWSSFFGIYVPFKYKLEEETDYLMSRVVNMREDGWLTAELYQFTSYQKEHDFKIEFSPCSHTCRHCYLEGIEFRPVEHELLVNIDDKNKVDVLQISISDADWEHKAWLNYMDLIKLSKDYVKWTISMKEHYALLRKGFLIDNGEDASSCLWLSISKKMKKHLMVPARAILVEGEWMWKSEPESRFEMVAKSLDQSVIRIFLQMKSAFLYHMTTYSCYLIYKLPQDYSLFEDHIIMSSTHSSNYYRSFFLVPPPHKPIIQHMFDQNHDIPLCTRKIKGYPKLRKDNWMEVPLFEGSTDGSKAIKMHLQLQGPTSMRGLVIQGIELRSL